MRRKGGRKKQRKEKINLIFTREGEVFYNWNRSGSMFLLDCLWPIMVEIGRFWTYSAILHFFWNDIRSNLGVLGSSRLVFVKFICFWSVGHVSKCSVEFGHL